MGDFSAKFGRLPTGIHTAEGTVAGGRAAALDRQRQADQAAFDEKKRALQQSQQSVRQLSKFGKGQSAETAASARQIGLVTADQFKQNLLRGPEEEETSKNEQAKKALVKEEKDLKRAQKRKRKERKKMLSTLSFAAEEEEEEEEEDVMSKKTRVTTAVGKDPTVDTHFLADRERDAALEAEREKLAEQWAREQQETKEAPLEIVYSYWDGSGHRRTARVKKGDSIGDFLEEARKALSTEFRELRAVAADALLYVKEDLILPHDITFYDLIVTKARGKSGPLFHFDVHDDVRVGALDVRIEKDESHPGKVVERRWYERNKHIFPASRWEIYDPTKEYGTYTIGGGIVTKKD